MFNRLPHAATLLVGILAAAGTASADVLFDSGDPDNGFFGVTGFDLSPNQDMAIGFRPAVESTLDSVGVWMMSNDFSGVTFPSYTLSIVTGDTEPNPLDVLESWTVQTTAVGFNPEFEEVTSTGITLQAGTQYWLLATSTAPEFENPVWVRGTGVGVYGIDNSFFPGWQIFDGIDNPGFNAPGALIQATPVPAPAGALLIAGAGGVALLRRR